MQEKDFITVYWSPAPFVPEETSWSHLYSEPTSLSSELLLRKNPDNRAKFGQSMYGCPSYIETMRNIFVVRNVIESKIDTSNLLLTQDNFEYPLVFNHIAPLLVKVQREPSIENYTNIMYNMGWLFFADEPLVARFTAPYFPPQSPGDGVILSTGEFDIGCWYRDFNLDYHVPPSTKELVFKEDQPLFYIDFKTDKKIVIKRYKLTKELRNMADEFVHSRERYGKFKTLQQRYLVSRKAKMSDQILSEIKKNIVD